MRVKALCLRNAWSATQIAAGAWGDTKIETRGAPLQTFNPPIAARGLWAGVVPLLFPAPNRLE